jgi:hypothetical protein
LTFAAAASLFWGLLKSLTSAILEGVPTALDVEYIAAWMVSWSLHLPPTSHAKTEEGEHSSAATSLLALRMVVMIIFIFSTPWKPREKGWYST